MIDPTAMSVQDKMRFLMAACSVSIWENSIPKPKPISVTEFMDKPHNICSMDLSLYEIGDCDDGSVDRYTGNAGAQRAILNRCSSDGLIILEDMTDSQAIQQVEINVAKGKPLMATIWLEYPSYIDLHMDQDTHRKMLNTAFIVAVKTSVRDAYRELQQRNLVELMKAASTPDMVAVTDPSEAIH